jgi:HD-like signal output (HDOD) protein
MERLTAVSRLNTQRVPVLPPRSAYLMQTMLDESLNFRQAAEIVERFPSIAARLIAVANSVWSSPVSPITSLEMACSRLGLSVVRSTSIALAVASPFDSSHCPAFDKERFWCHLLLVADTATWLAQKVADQARTPPLTARLAGLLHDLGLLWLVDQLGEETQQAILLSQQEPDISLSKALLDIIAIDYCEAGSILGSIWGLPEPLRVAMQHKTIQPGTRPHWQIALVVDLADCLVSVMEKDIPCAIPDSRLQSLNLRHEHVGWVLQQLYQQRESIQDLACILFSHPCGALS